ncbi:hypothetical protein [Candidatus Nitrospira nitrificans]|uniref:hypothetical protein n=1 Tax=Candidatus Nitrospira nitrificans TaxID=1742973 RepID=UPI001C2FE69D|nr:hypothetical protein [Candidatus Nitrospira nitrificans]
MPPRFIPDGAEGKREEGFFQVAQTVEEHPLVDEKTGFAVGGALERIADDRPGGEPAFFEVLPHRPGMFGGADRPVAVVVDLHALRPPSDGNGKIGGETQTHRRPQALRPGLDRSQRRV